MSCPSTFGKNSRSQGAVLAGHLTPGVAMPSLKDIDNMRNLQLNGPSRTLHTDEVVLIQGKDDRPEVRRPGSVPPHL